MPEILDSGNRREFNTGAVRDIAEGKGRMDLLPLQEIADFVRWKRVNEDVFSDASLPFTFSLMMELMSRYLRTRNDIHIYKLLYSFMHTHYDSIESAILDLSIHYEQGAKKYAERNWEKGISCHCYVDSALRHGTKFLRGDTDEPHGRAFMWNLFGLLWTLEHRPECDDLPAC